VDPINFTCTTNLHPKLVFNPTWIPRAITKPLRTMNTWRRIVADFIIDLPYLKSWYLPDGRHIYTSALHGDHFYITIRDSVRGEVVLSHHVKIDKEDKWKDLLSMSQELANKKYAKPLRHKSNEGRARVGL
jgi:hypothetical protein